MKKIKHIFPKVVCGQEVIDKPMNDFIATLPEGSEITRVVYVLNEKEGKVCSAVIEYDA